MSRFARQRHNYWPREGVSEETFRTGLNHPGLAGSKLETRERAYDAQAERGQEHRDFDGFFSRCLVPAIQPLWRGIRSPCSTAVLRRRCLATGSGQRSHRNRPRWVNQFKVKEGARQ